MPIPAHKAPRIQSAHELPQGVDTRTAAGLLGRKPQTLRKWASQQKGPLQPVHIHGRLLWRLDDIARVLGVQA